MARFKPVHHIKGIFNLVVFLALIECLLTAGRVSAGSREIQYIFMGNKYYGSLAGTETMAGLQRSLYFMEDRFIPPLIWDESNILAKSGGVLFRFLKTLLLDNIPDHLIFLSQHEVFEHGARYREFGIRNNSYTLNLIPPYGDGSGFARMGIISRTLTMDENLTRTIAGNEVTAIISEIIQQKWIARGMIHFREVPFYILSRGNLPFYTLKTKINPTGTGGDIGYYLTLLNWTEPGIPEREKILTDELF